MKINFILESVLPTCKRWNFIVENVIIPFFPNGPSSNHKKINKVRASKILLLLHNHLTDIRLKNPLQANRIPPGFA